MVFGFETFFELTEMLLPRFKVLIEVFYEEGSDLQNCLCTYIYTHMATLY